MIGQAFSLALLGTLACFAQEQTATLTGIVTDFVGTPQKQIKARLESTETADIDFAAETDTGGRFRFSDIPAGNYRLLLGVRIAKTWEHEELGIRLLAGQELVLPRGVLIRGFWCDPLPASIQVFQPGDASGMLRGSVVDGSRFPIRGASVTLNCNGCVATTNGDGWFAFSNLKPGTYAVAVSKNGFYPAQAHDFSVFKNLNGTYAPIQLKRCPLGACGLWPRRHRIVRCD